MIYKKWKPRGDEKKVLLESTSCDFTASEIVSNNINVIKCCSILQRLIFLFQEVVLESDYSRKVINWG